MDDEAIQTRCPNCLAELYVLNVMSFSDGETPCPSCGEKTRVMSYREWYDVLKAARAAREKQ